ncbi:hypothetical protein BB558_004121, partial [Smittium angustum]
MGFLTIPKLSLLCGTLLAGINASTTETTHKSLLTKRDIVVPNIIGGTYSNFVNVESIAYYGIDGETDYRCTGTLIAPNVVITAAHCIYETQSIDPLSWDKIRIGVGSVEPLPQNINSYKVDKIEINPDFSHTPPYRNDLALIFLKECVPPSIATPIDLAMPDLNDSEYIVAGFGQTSQDNKAPSNVKELIVTEGNIDLCKKYFTEAEIGTKVICVGQTYGLGTCYGDSGGPMYSIDYGKLLGVESSIISINGQQCNSVDTVAVYVLPLGYLPWIHTYVPCLGPDCKCVDPTASGTSSSSSSSPSSTSSSKPSSSPSSSSNPSSSKPSSSPSSSSSSPSSSSSKPSSSNPSSSPSSSNPSSSNPSSSPSSSNPSSSSTSCDYSFGDISVPTGSGDQPNKIYNTDNRVSIPCTGNEFQINFTVDQTSDIYFMITNTDTISGTTSIIGEMGVDSGKWFIGDYITDKTVDVPKIQEDTVDLFIIFNANGVYIGSNGKEITHLLSDEFDMDNLMSTGTLSLFFGAENSNALVSDVVVSCLNDDVCSPSSSSSSSPSSSSPSSSPSSSNPSSSPSSSNPSSSPSSSNPSSSPSSSNPSSSPSSSNPSSSPSSSNPSSSPSSPSPSSSNPSSSPSSSNPSSSP